MSPAIQCVDLFCGAGGMSWGLKKAGIDVRLGVDVDEEVRYPYEANVWTPLWRVDIHDVKSPAIRAQYTYGASMLAGCAPCQPFSTLSPKSRSNNDPRRSLIGQFARLVGEVVPDLVVTENVPAASRSAEFKEFIDTLNKLGYHVAAGVLNFMDYGVPQKRKRLIVMASRLAPIQLPAPEIPLRQPSVASAITEMPPIEAGQIPLDDPIHCSPSLSKINRDRIQASRPGGTWRDWDKHLLAPCQIRNDGKYFTDSYGRMEWDRPSPTLTTRFFVYGAGRFGHPEQDRVITFREAALLQTFPMDYTFVREDRMVSKRSLGCLIGNAIPPLMGAILGKAFTDHLQSAV